MKGVYVLLEKDGILVRTQYTDVDRVRWTDGERSVAELLTAGYVIVRVNLVNKALHALERLRGALCYGDKVTNEDLLEIIKLLRDY